MRELKALIALELRTLYGFNKFRHTKDKKAKNRYKLLAAVWIALAVMVFFYIGALVFGLCTLGLSDTVPSYLVTVSTLIVLMFGIFRAGAVIFAKSGYDILISMPVRKSSIVISRFVLLYVDELIFTSAIMLSGTVVYGICMKPSFGFYVYSVLATLLVPIIPLLISLLLGTLVSAVSSRMKHKSLVEAALGVGIVIAALLLSFFGGALEGADDSVIADFASQIAKAVEKIYPPAAWVGDAMLGNGAFCFVLYSVISILLMISSIFVTVKLFEKIMRAVFVSVSGGTYKLEKQRGKSPLKALTVREFRRYFASSVYVVNTVTGPILALAVTLGLCIFGAESVGELLPNANTKLLLAIAVGTCISMAPTTSVSVSMEGKQIDIIKSLPISTRTWLNSKLMLYFILAFPFYIISEAVALAVLKPDFTEALVILLFPLANALLCGIFGLLVNLKLHTFDWDREEYVVKQSAPAAIGCFSGLLTGVLAFLLSVLLPAAFSEYALLILSAVMLTVSAALYGYIGKTEISKL